MNELFVQTTDEVAYKNSIWDERAEKHRLLSQAAKVLSQRTGLLSLVTTNNGDLYYSGIANLLTQPEFLDLNLSRNLFSRLDEVNFWERILEDFVGVEDEIRCILGEEDFHDPTFDDCASVWGEFEGKKIKGIIGVVGPKRMYYDLIIPQIKYFSNLIEEIVKEQNL